MCLALVFTCHPNIKVGVLALPPMMKDFLVLLSGEGFQIVDHKKHAGETV